MKTVPLRHLFRRAKILGHTEEPMVSVFRDLGVVYKKDHSNYNKTAEDRSIYQLVDDDWLVVNRMKAWQGALGVSRIRGIVSGHYLCFQPQHGEDSRFLHYLLRAPRMVRVWESISRGVRPSQIEIDNDALESTRLTLPPLDEQRRIADFLDDRVARIDQIIAARRQQIADVAEQTSSIPDHLLPDAMWRAPHRLGRYIVSIEQGWSPQCEAVPAVESDWGVLKVSAVRGGRFLPQENKRLPDNVAPRLEYRVQPGDLLVTRANTPTLVGAFAVVPDGVRDRLLLCDKIMRIRLSNEMIPEFVSMVGQSHRTRDQLGMAGTGTSQSMVNIRGDDIRGLQIPLMHPETQRSIVREWHATASGLGGGLRDLQRSIDLLTEYKSSLITAAVTGELYVTTACRRIPGE